MVHQGLTVVGFSVRDDVSHITALDGIVAVLLHKLIGGLHPALIIGNGRRRLVVHNNTDTLLVGILVKGRQVVVRIRGDEVKDIILLTANPVFPAFVPAFHQNGVKAIGGGIVNVSAHVLVIGRMASVGRGLGIVGYAQPHGGILIRIGPSLAAGNHLPPDAHILHGMDPTHILQGAGLIEIEDDAAGQGLLCAVHHHNGTPGRVAGRLHMGHPAFGVRGEPGAESHSGGIQVKAGHRIILHRGLVQVDVQAFVGLHLDGHLHARLGEHLLRGITRQLVIIVPVLDSAQARGVIGIFLGIVVSGNPPGRMVSGHSVLRELVLDYKIGKVVLLGELVAEAQAVVKDAEAEQHSSALFIFKGDRQFIIMVADFGFFSPDRLPSLVKGGTLRLLQGKTVVEAFGGAIGLDGLLLKRLLHTRSAELHAQARGQDHVRLTALERIHGNAVHNGHLQFQLPVGALNHLGIFREGRDRRGHASDKTQGSNSQKKQLLHKRWLSVIRIKLRIIPLISKLTASDGRLQKGEWRPKRTR